jgi:UDP-N-acetylglucosamine diphosphorylase/glucosamine-1-phosphate N-acetyltransferase
MTAVNEKNEKMNSRVAVIILAAGLGTRMKSDRAKVLHEINQVPMILYVVKAANAVAVGEIIVVIGHQADQVRATVSDKNIKFAIQDRQMGTGHAVLCAMPNVSESIEHIVVLCGDVPLLKPDTVTHLMADHLSAGRDVTVVAVEVMDPTGYGRLVIGADRVLSGIVEEADASESQKKIKTINAGIYCINRKFLQQSLDKLTPSNAQGEVYLTDIVAMAHGEKRPVGYILASDPVEVAGVNTPAQLLAAETALQAR